MSLFFFSASEKCHVWLQVSCDLASVCHNECLRGWASGAIICGRLAITANDDPHAGGPPFMRRARSHCSQARTIKCWCWLLHKLSSIIPARASMLTEGSQPRPRHITFGDSADRMLHAPQRLAGSWSGTAHAPDCSGWEIRGDIVCLTTNKFSGLCRQSSLRINFTANTDYVHHYQEKQLNFLTFLPDQQPRQLNSTPVPVKSAFKHTI